MIIKFHKCSIHLYNLKRGLCHFVTLSLCHFVTLSLCHFVTLSLCHFVTLSLCHFVTLSLCHFVTSYQPISKIFLSDQPYTKPCPKRSFKSAESKKPISYSPHNFSQYIVIYSYFHSNVISY